MTTSKRIKVPTVKGARKPGRPKSSGITKPKAVKKEAGVLTLHKPAAARIGQDYYNTVQWGIALNTIVGGVVVTSIEFYPKHPGRVRKITGNVIHTFENAIPGMPLVQRTLLSVTWNHAGECRQRNEHLKQYDVTDSLKTASPIAAGPDIAAPIVNKEPANESAQ